MLIIASQAFVVKSQLHYKHVLGKFNKSFVGFYKLSREYHGTISTLVY